MDRREFIGGLFSVPLALKLDLSKLEEAKKSLPIQLTAEDLAKAQLLEPGWHKVQIVDLFEKTSNITGDRLVGVVFQSEDGARITQYISEKAPQPVLNLLRKTDLVRHDMPEAIDLSGMLGKRITINVKSKTNQDGRRFNYVEG